LKGGTAGQKLLALLHNSAHYSTPDLPTHPSPPNPSTHIHMIETILPLVAASIYILIALISVVVLLKKHGGAPFFLVFAVTTILLTSVAGACLRFFNSALLLHLVTMCMYTLSIAGISVVYIDEMSLIRALPQLFAYRIRRIVVLGAFIFVCVVFVLGVTALGLTDTNESGVMETVSKYICPALIYTVLLVVSFFQFRSSRRVLMLVLQEENKQEEAEDDEEDEGAGGGGGGGEGGKIGTPKVAGYNEAKTKTMTSAFQNTLIRCVRRLAIELFCIALCGLIALSDTRVFESFMDVCLFVAMVDVLWSTKSYLWGVEIENKANKKDGKGVSNKYSQETTAVSVGGILVPVEEASSSEDDEGQDNTFFFPIAIQQITTSMGPLSQNKRYSIR